MMRSSIVCLVASFYWGTALAFSPRASTVTSRMVLKSSLSSEQDDVMDKFNQALSQQQQETDFSQLQQEQFAVNNPAMSMNNNPAMSQQEQQQLVSELEALSQRDKQKEQPVNKFSRLDQQLEQTVKEFSKEFSQAFSEAYQEKKLPAQVFQPKPPKTKPSQAVFMQNLDSDPVMDDYNRAFQNAVPMGESGQVWEDGQTQGETVDETEDSNRPNKFTFSQRIASVQSYVVGATMGMVAIAPFTALHHLYFYPSYQGLAAWEFDTVTAALQGALFAAVYRYSMRQDLDNDQLRKAVVMAFVLIRSIVRVHVPLQCLALPLTCGEPFEFMNWAMLGELVMNTVESLALFCTVADTMDALLKRKSVKEFPG